MPARTTAFVACLALLLAPSALQAQATQAQATQAQATQTQAPQAQPADNAADLAAIRATEKTYVDAFNRGDAKAVAALWTADGVYSDQFGGVVHGRDAIEKAFTEYFAKHQGAKLGLDIESMHLPEPGVAVEVGNSVTTTSDSAESGSRYQAVHVKQEGTWKLQSVEEGPALPASNYQRLKDLHWMLGSWIDESTQKDDKKVVVYTQSRWSMNRNFIVRNFTQTLDNRVVMTAEQRIGWYEPEQQIRSWTFDSDGGVSISAWSKVGDGWVVKTDRVGRDGKQLIEVETATIDSPHSHTWRITERKLAGQELPDMEIKVQRQEVQPAQPQPQPQP